MRRGVLVVPAVLGAVVLAAALAAALATGSEGGARSDLFSGRPVRAIAALSPRAQLFGDPVVARVKVIADTGRVEPGSIRVSGSFGAYSAVGKPTLERRRVGSREYVVWTTRLRCLRQACVPGKRRRRVMFAPASVNYSLGRGERAAPRSVAVAWPPLLVYSRVDQVEVDALDPRDEPPWQADYRSLPTVSYSAPPNLIASLLYAGGGLMIACALVLVAPLVRREKREVVSQAKLTAVWLPPLEQALALLEKEPRDDGEVEPRRQALELVAEALGRRGAIDLERSARRLAWSEEPPLSEVTRALAQKVRNLVGKEGHDESAV